MPEVSKSIASYHNDPNVPAFDDSRPLFVFDGVCVLCSGGASWIMRNDHRSLINLAPAQEPLGQALYTHYGMQMDDTYLFIANGRAFTASRGYLELCRIMGGWWHVCRTAAIVPELFRDWLYARIAKNRYRWFGKTGYCALLTPEQRSRLLKSPAHRQ